MTDTTMASRTQQALAWLAAQPKKKAVPYRAARRFKLSTSVVYRAVKAQQQKLARRRRVCPTCGASLPTAR